MAMSSLPDSIEALVGSDVTGAMRIEKIFEIFGDPKQEYRGGPMLGDSQQRNQHASRCP